MVQLSLPSLDSVTEDNYGTAVTLLKEKFGSKINN